MGFFMEMITMISNYNGGGAPLTVKYSVIDTVECPLLDIVDRSRIFEFDDAHGREVQH